MALVAGEYRLRLATIRVGSRPFRHRLPCLAELLDQSAGAGAALDIQAAGQSSLDLDVEAVPVTVVVPNSFAA